MRRGRVLRWGAVVLYAAFIFWLSSLQESPLSSGWVPPDKPAHLLLYTGLGLLIGWALSREGGRAGRLFPLWAVLLTALYGLSDEIHQHFVPGRNPDAADLAVDVLGGLLGQAILLGGRRMRQR